MKDTDRQIDDKTERKTVRQIQTEKDDNTERQKENKMIRQKGRLKDTDRQKNRKTIRQKYTDRQI